MNRNFTTLIIFLIWALIASNAYAQNQEIKSVDNSVRETEKISGKTPKVLPSIISVEPEEISDRERDLVDSLSYYKRHGMVQDSRRLQEALDDLLDSRFQPVVDDNHPDEKAIGFREIEQRGPQRDRDWGGDFRIWRGGAMQKAPVIASSEDGDLYVAFENYDDRYPHTYITIRRSTDGGRNWNPYIHVHDDNGELLGPDIVIGEGVEDWVFLVYEQRRNGRIRCYRRSLDGEDASFATVFNPDGNHGAFRRPNICVDTDENYYIFVVALTTYRNNTVAMISRSTNYGENFGRQDVRYAPASSNVDIDYGRLGLFFVVQSAANFTGNSNFWIRYSTNYGANWSGAVSTSNSGDNAYPSIKVDDNINNALIIYNNEFSNDDHDIYYSYTENRSNWVRDLRLDFDGEDSKFPVLQEGIGFHVVYWNEDDILYSHAMENDLDYPEDGWPDEDDWRNQGCIVTDDPNASDDDKPGIAVFDQTRVEEGLRDEVCVVWSGAGISLDIYGDTGIGENDLDGDDDGPDLVAGDCYIALSDDQENFERVPDEDVPDLRYNDNLYFILEYSNQGNQDAEGWGVRAVIRDSYYGVIVSSETDEDWSIGAGNGSFAYWGPRDYRIWLGDGRPRWENHNPHSITWTLDYGNSVPELNEDNNECIYRWNSTNDIEEDPIVRNVNLFTVFPNPFNSAANIGFKVPYPSSVRLTIYDLSGKEVQIIYNENNSQGLFNLVWYTSNMSPGIYFAKLRINNDDKIVKLMLLK